MIGTARKLIKKSLASRYASDYPKLIKLGAIERPNYAYIVYRAADLARRLGIQRISALEFGVAGGNGLVNMERHAERVEVLTGVRVDVYGFDTGEGLPPPADYRDLPYVWQESHFKMDQEALKARLKRAKLVLGLVSDTTRQFAEEHNPAPIGAISFDLDYYSSTVDALKIFETSAAFRLPRVFVYLDDCASSDFGHVGPRVGVPLAVHEFNAASDRRHLGQLNHLQFQYAPVRPWHHRIYSFADFDHPLHDTYIMGGDRQLSL